MSLSGSEQSSRSERVRGRRKLFRKRDRRSRSSERYEFSDLDDDVFLRGPRKLRREDVEGELSYDYNSPGRLKVFTAGLNHSGGVPEFKTVLVASNATAADVIASVLERCEILYDDEDEFFLCEVIGKLQPYNSGVVSTRRVAQFVEQCRRIIGPTEHVLVIQALWKPLFGYYRRFELKQISRRQSRSRRTTRLTASRPNHQLLNGDSGVSSDFNDFFRHYDLDFDDSKSERRRRRIREVGTQSEAPTTHGRRAAGTQTEAVYFASADRRLRKKYSVPLGPFLLLLKGFDSRHDLLVNDLYETNVLGSDDTRCDIHLRCADVMPEHCVIETCHSDCDGSRPFCMTVASIGHAEVLLNGRLVVGRQRLVPGDVVSIGAGEMRSYAFMFKDASQVPDRTVGLGWLEFLEVAQRSSQGMDFGNYSESAISFASTTVPSDSVLGSPKPEPDAEACIFAQSSLRAVLTLYFSEAVDLKYSAGLLALIVTYVSDMRLKEAEAEIQCQVSDAFLALCKKSVQISHSLNDRIECYNEMIRACFLAFELFLFFHNDVAVSSVEDSRRWREFCESVMQQMLDNVFDKLGQETLEQSLALFDFGIAAAATAGKSSESELANMDSFITFLTRVNQAFVSYDFQCVDALKQMIMKRLVFLIAKNFVLRLMHNDSKDLLKWSRAVQLRINLDQFEEWLRQEQLEMFLPSLALPNSLVDLLAIRKSQLCNMSWSMLRNSFPEIPPAAMLHALAEYDGGCGPKQTLWTVAREDADEAEYDANCSLEDYFQLAIERCEIPIESAECCVQLRQLLEDKEFKELMLHLDQQTAVPSCQLRWRRLARHVHRLVTGQSRPHTPTPADPFKSLDSDGSRSASAGGDVRGDYYDEVEDDEEEEEEEENQRATPLASAAEFGGFDNDAASTTSAASLMDARTLANTIRNEIHAHRVVSEDLDDSVASRTVGSEYGSDAFDAAPTAAAAASERPACPLGFHGNLGDSGRVERLYDWQKQQRQQQQQLILMHKQQQRQQQQQQQQEWPGHFNDVQRPPAPPPRSCSLASSRCSRVASDTESQASLANCQRAEAGREEEDEEEEEEGIFCVVLTRSEGQSYGLELVDGRKTELGKAGVFVRAIRSHSPAAACRRIQPGCRIIAVNNHSLVDQSYSRCVSLIKESQSVIELMVANTNGLVAKRVLTSTC